MKATFSDHCLRYNSYKPKGTIENINRNIILKTQPGSIFSKFDSIVGKTVILNIELSDDCPTDDNRSVDSKITDFLLK